MGLVPAAAAELVRLGHGVTLETTAGDLSGYSDEDYQSVGVVIVADARALYGSADIIVKVKEPLAPELDYLRPEHLLFSFLHLAALPELTQRLLDIGLTAVGFETVQTASGRLPLLAPMSDIAGRLSIQLGLHYLHQPMGGKGLLLGGLPAAERGNVVVIGAGNVGGNAVAMAAQIGANVTVFDRNRDKLERMRAIGANVTGLYPYQQGLAEAVTAADLLVGAVLVPGERAAMIVSAEMVKSMQPGSVIVDVSVDQGGCIETTRPTSYQDPTFIWEGVVHFGVTNMPGAVPRSASQALSAALMPYLERLVAPNWRQDPALLAGINVSGGKCIHPALVDMHRH